MVVVRDRVYRSRVIWDETRKEGSSYQAYINAILYELQPFPKNAISSSLTRLGHSMHWLITRLIPAMFKSVYHVMKEWRIKEWTIVFAVFLFWQFVRFLHRYVRTSVCIYTGTYVKSIFNFEISRKKSIDAIMTIILIIFEEILLYCY